VQMREPETVNILTALAENETVVNNENDAGRKAIALAWLFHLVGDIHHPYTRRSYLLLSTSRVIEEGTKLHAGEASEATDGPAQVLG
jgi:hypothetical protein